MLLIVSSEKPETLDTGSLDSSQRVTQHSSFRPTKQNSRLKVGGVVELRLNESEVCVCYSLSR